MVHFVLNWCGNDMCTDFNPQPVVPEVVPVKATHPKQAKKGKSTKRARGTDGKATLVVQPPVDDHQADAEFVENIVLQVLVRIKQLILNS